MNVRLKDIAEELDLSIATVSMAIRDSDRVNRETRELVKSTAERMGYKPRPSKQDNRILEEIVYLYANDNPMGDARSDFYSMLFSSIEAASREHKIRISFRPVTHKLKPADIADDPSTCGVVLTTEMPANQLQKLQDDGLVMVMINHTHPLLTIDRVLIADFRAVYGLVAYLHNKGHQNIAYLGPGRLDSSFANRLDGYHMAVNDLGLLPIELTALNVFPHAVYDFVRQYIQDHAQLPFTALLCSHDTVAVNALNALQDSGVNVPQDVSIVGFNDLETAKIVRPQLTTCRVPRNQLGEWAVRLLLERTEQPDLPTRIIQLDAEIIERESVLTRS